MLSIIVALGRNYEIGQNNQLLCHLPDDLKRFKTITNGHTVLMGENTYLSLPIRPLPNRKNIVLTLNKDTVYEGCLMAYSIEEALMMCKKEEETFIIGGASVYKQFYPLSDKLYLTLMDAEFKNADAFFPKIHINDWQLIEETFHATDEKHMYNFLYQIYVRKEKNMI